MKHAFWLVGLLLLVTACGEAPYFEENKAISESGWTADQPAEFQVTIDDTVQPYHFFVNFRHSGAYDYSNVYLFFHTEFPNGKTSRDTVELVLQHPDGRWKGTGGGGLYENRYMIKYARRFPLTGPYTFQIEQAMRDEELAGVSDVGFRLEEAVAD